MLNLCQHIKSVTCDAFCYGNSLVYNSAPTRKFSGTREIFQKKESIYAVRGTILSQHCFLSNHISKEAMTGRNGKHETLRNTESTAPKTSNTYHRINHQSRRTMCIRRHWCVFLLTMFNVILPFVMKVGNSLSFVMWIEERIHMGSQETNSQIVTRHARTAEFVLMCLFSIFSLDMLNRSLLVWGHNNGMSCLKRSMHFLAVNESSSLYRHVAFL